MKISPINNNNVYNSKNHQHTNFKGITVTSALVLLARREGVNAINSFKKNKYLSELQDCITCYDKEKFVDGVRAIVKTPDEYFDDDHCSLWNDLFSDKILRYIPELRLLALNSIDMITDDSYINIQAKKDLITSFFDNGHEVSQLLVKKFAQLNDGLYSTFKVETVDKCLFSDKYNSNRSLKIFSPKVSILFDKYELAKPPNYLGCLVVGNDKKTKVAYNNLMLISTLDKDIYKGYLSRIRNLIDYYKGLVRDHAYSCPKYEHMLIDEILRKDYETRISSI